MGEGVRLHGRATAFAVATFIVLASWIVWLPPPASAQGQARFLPPHADSGVDFDGDGTFDVLRVAVNINVTEGTVFTLRAQVYDISNTSLIDAMQLYQDLQAPGTIDLDLSGFRIRDSGFDGPYRVNLYVLDYFDAPLDFNAHTTQPYVRTEFDAPSGRLAPPYADTGVDTDGDLLFDEILVDVFVNVNEAGPFSLVGILLDSTGTVLLRSERRILYRGAGFQTVGLSFPTLPMVARGFDGPYVLDVSLYSTEWVFLGRDRHTTPSYLRSDFDPLPVAFAPPHADFGVDRDGDLKFNVLQVDVHVDVAQPGTFSVRGTLLEASTSALITSDFRVMTLGAGPQTIPLVFSGPEIRWGLRNGPYSILLTLRAHISRATLNVASDTHITGAYLATDFDSETPATLDGVVRDLGSGLAIPDVSVFAYNYRDRTTFITSTDASGAYSYPLYVGDWIIEADDETHQSAVARVTVSASTSRDVQLSPSAPYTFLLATSMPDWDSMSWRSDEVFAEDQARFRISMDWTYGNADGLVAQSELDTWNAAIGAIPKVPTNTEDFFAPDGTVYDLVPGTDSVTYFDVEGPVESAPPWRIVLQGEYSSPTPIPRQRTHEVLRRAILDTPNSVRTYLVDAPSGYPFVDYRALPGVTVAGLGTPNATLDPLLDPRPLDLISSIWVRLRAVAPDTLAPTIESATAAPDPSDVGQPVSFEAHATDDWTLVGLSLQIRDPGGVEVANLSMTPAGGDRFDASYTSPVVGLHTFTVWAVDDSANYGSLGGQFTVLDPIAPIVTSVAGAPSPQEYGQPTTITAFASDNVAVVSVTATVLDPGGSPLGPYPMSYNGTSGLYEVSRTFLALGTFTVTVEAGDGAGNSGNASGTFEVLDRTPPSISAAYATPNPVEPGTQVTVFANITDLAGVSDVLLVIHDPLFIDIFLTMTLVSGSTYSAVFTPTQLGTHPFDVRAVDGSGNVGNSSGSFEARDLTGPSLTEVMAVPPIVELGNPVLISAKAVDVVGVANVSVEIRNGTGEILGTWEMALNASTGAYEHGQLFLFLGVFSFTVTALDSSGNQASASGGFLIQDTTPPVVLNAIVSPDPGELGAPTSFSAEAVDLAGVTSAIVAVLDPYGLPIGPLSMTWNSSSGRWETSRVFPRVGQYEYLILALDPTGNAGFAGGVFDVVDTTAPLLFGAVANPDPVEFGGFTEISVLATDLGGLGPVTLEVRDPFDVIFGIFSMPSAGPNAYAFPVTPTMLGTYTFQISTSDPSGNSAATSGSFAVRDTVGPFTFAGPDQAVLTGTLVSFDGTATLDIHGVTNYTWTFTDVGAVVLYGPTPSYRFNRPGEFTVTLTARDSSGNLGSDSLLVDVHVPTGDVQGVVSDESDTPIVGAIVRLLNGTTLVDSATTNATGVFEFTGLPPGTYALEVSATGFLAADQSVAVVADETTSVTVTLQRTPAAPPSDATAWIVGGLLAAVVLAAIAILLWRRSRRRQGKVPTEVEKPG